MIMKKTSLLFIVVAIGFASGLEVSSFGAETNLPPGSIYIGPPAPAAAPPPSAPAQSGTNNLEKLAMPIALHPDPLVAIILPASAYPLEIVQAARFVKDTNNIAKLDTQPWDANVKAVARFPDLIAMMDKEIAWTMELGQAFIDQPKQLMDTIQALRGKAHKAGTLQSNPQQVVSVSNVIVIQTNYTEIVRVTNEIVQVVPSNPSVVYVPTYPPTVYYPPPAYVYDPWAPLVTFGVGMAWGAILANNCDWHGGCVWGGGDVDIDIDNNVNIDRGDRNVNRGDRPSQTSGNRSGNRASNTGAKPSQQKWQPDKSRLQKSGAPTAQTREARGWGGGSSGGGAGWGGGGSGARPGAQPATGGGGGARPSTQPSRSGGGSAAARPSAGQSSANRASPSAGNRSSGSVNRGGSSSAFSGMNSGGGGARSFSSRGASSRGGGGGFRGGGGGRR